jgi:hypothetical protein
MTNEEWWEKIEKTWNHQNARSLLGDALRAVVELHKPEHSITGYRCTHCTLEVTYPCATIQAIEKELA